MRAHGGFPALGTPLLLPGGRVHSLRQPTISPASSLFPFSVQVLPIVGTRACATLVVCRREQQHKTDQLRPFPAQTETARRIGKQAAEQRAPCSRKPRLEEEAVTALKAVAREHPARWTCSPFEGDQAGGLTLLAFLMAQQGRPSQLTVAPLQDCVGERDREGNEA
jgi:hypothetical protein